MGFGISKIATLFLEEIQQDPLSTIYSEGRINKRKNEGSITKNSIRALLAIDKICYVKNLTDDEFEEALPGLIQSLEPKPSNENNEENHLLRYGITAWFGDKGSKADELTKNLKNASTTNDKRELLNTVYSEMMRGRTKEKKN